MKKEENYLLFVPSLMNKPNKIRYQAGEEIYEGVQTNEAMTKYIVNYLWKKGEKLDKIIMFCSYEVQNKKLDIIDGRTTLEYYEDQIQKFIKNRFQEERIAEDLFEIISYTSGNDGESEMLHCCCCLPAGFCKSLV